MRNVPNPKPYGLTPETPNEDFPMKRLWLLLLVVASCAATAQAVGLRAGVPKGVMIENLVRMVNSMVGRADADRLNPNRLKSE